MSSFHHIQQSHLQPLQGNHGHTVPHLIPFFPVYDTYPTFAHHDLNQQLEDEEESSNSGASCDPLIFMVSLPTKDEDHHDKASSCAIPKHGWMSSKMRLMRKMMNANDGEIARKLSKRSGAQVPSPPQDDHQHPPAIIRVCSDCNTTRTPLWRSGPQGPKSLCNACGIRQRKARKAMAAAAAEAVNATAPESADHKQQQQRELKPSKDKCLEAGGACEQQAIVPFKKRCKFANAGAAADAAKRFEDSGVSSTAQKAFPQDEKDAAILLMALSCGLVCR